MVRRLSEHDELLDYKIVNRSVPVFEFELPFLGNAIRYFFGFPKVPICLFKGNRWFLSQNSTVHLRVLVLNFLDLLFPEGDVEGLDPVDPFPGATLVLTDFSYLFEEDAVFPFDFCVLIFEEVVALGVVFV